MFHEIQIVAVLAYFKSCCIFAFIVRFCAILRSNDLQRFSDNGQNGTPFSLAVTNLKEKNYLYAANGSDGTISGFKINPITGNLQFVPGSPFATTGQPANYSLVVSPDNRFLFVASDAAALLHVFRISRGTGRLREVPGGPFKVDTSFSGLKVSTNGMFLLAGGNPNGGIAGSLSPIAGSSFLLPDFTAGIAITPKGNLLYTALFISGAVDGQSIDTDGTLTPVPGTPFITGEHAITGLMESVVTFPAPACSQH